MEFVHSEPFTRQFILLHSPQLGALGKWRALYEISPKECGRGHGIYFRRSTHSHDSSRGVSEFSPSNNFFHEVNDFIHHNTGNFMIGAPRTCFPDPNLSDGSVICLGGSTCNGLYVFSTGGPRTTRTVYNIKVNKPPIYRICIQVRLSGLRTPPQDWCMAVVEEVRTSSS